MALQKIDINYDTALEIASHEAVIRQTYKDSVGVLTWSVGLTRSSGVDPMQWIGHEASLHFALSEYIRVLRAKYLPAVLRAFEGYTLSREQLTAALSFHWNTGAIEKATWVKLVKQGKHIEAKKAFMRYRIPAEIIPRREKERDLFFLGKWSNDGFMTEYTRLTKNMTPVWSSAKRIDVRTVLTSILALTPDVPQPPVVVDKVVPPVQNAPSLWAKFMAWLRSN